MEATERKRISEEFLDRVRRLPDGERLLQCLQCGTCSASCPVAEAMDHAPRQIVAWLRAGEIDRVLASNTVWFCASCYLCAVRCPAGIPFTDVMYALKRLSVEKGIAHKGARSLVLAREFARSVDRHGRVSESELLRNYFLRTNPFAALPQMPVAARLFFRGRLPVRPHGIEGLEGLRRMLAAVEENGK